jgi:hypothetical protein
MLTTAALNDIDVMASFNVKIAVPNDTGLGAPVLVVGTVGGFSWAFVNVASRIVSAEARAAGTSTTTAASKAVHNRLIYYSFLGSSSTKQTSRAGADLVPFDRTGE